MINGLDKFVPSFFSLEEPKKHWNILKCTLKLDFKTHLLNTKGNPVTLLVDTGCFLQQEKKEGQHRLNPETSRNIKHMAVFTHKESIKSSYGEEDIKR